MDRNHCAKGLMMHVSYFFKHQIFFFMLMKVKKSHLTTYYFWIDGHFSLGYKTLLLLDPRYFCTWMQMIKAKEVFLC
jgi:hypothetical protein